MSEHAIKQVEHVENTENDEFVYTPELIAALQEAEQDADENPGRSYTYEELMGVLEDALARHDQQ